MVQNNLTDEITRSAITYSRAIAGVIHSENIYLIYKHPCWRWLDSPFRFHFNILKTLCNVVFCRSRLFCLNDFSYYTAEYNTLHHFQNITEGVWSSTVNRSESKGLMFEAWITLTFGTNNFLQEVSKIKQKCLARNIITWRKRKRLICLIFVQCNAIEAGKINWEWQSFSWTIVADLWKGRCWVTFL